MAGGRDEAADEICERCPEFEIVLVANLGNAYDYVGHAFVAIDQPADNCMSSTGKLVRGFYPAAEQDPRSVLWEGAPGNAPGIVYDDGRSYARKANLYQERTYKISCGRANAAIRFIQNREQNPGVYSLWTRQCSHFALDVLREAGIDVSEFTPEDGPVRPSYIYQVLSGHRIPAARWPPQSAFEDDVRNSINDANNQLERKILQRGGITLP